MLALAIAVVGSSRSKPSQRVFKSACHVGRRFCQAGTPHKHCAAAFMTVRIVLLSRVVDGAGVPPGALLRLLGCLLAGLAGAGAPTLLACPSAFASLRSLALQAGSKYLGGTAGVRPLGSSAAPVAPLLLIDGRLHSDYEPGAGLDLAPTS